MLTRKQHELIVFIDKYLKETGVSPSFEEMKDALALRSKSGIHRLISALEERGFLRRYRHRARALDVLRLPENMSGVLPHPSASAMTAAVAIGGETVSLAQNTAIGFVPNVIQGDFSARLAGARTAPDVAAVSLPLYGKIAAGQPIEALRDTGDQLEVPAALLNAGEHYALEVSGDSMVEAGILDGDLAIIRRGDSADNGQIVVALIDRNEVTLKRLRRRGASIALEPANERYETRIFPADRVVLQGRLVALLRRY